jgi:hypothetical protein
MRYADHNVLDHRLTLWPLMCATRFGLALVGSALVMILRFITARLAPGSALSGRRGRSQQVRYPQHCVATDSERGHEADLFWARELHLSQGSAVFAPTKSLLDALAHLLAELIAFVPSRASVERRATGPIVVASQVRGGDAALAAAMHKISSVVRAVSQ